MTDKYKELLDEGIFKIQDGKFNEAIEFINKSIQLKSDWEISYFYRAVAYQAMEKFDDAILDYTKSLKINPKMIDAYYNRAKILLEQKENKTEDLNKIAKDLEIALSLDEKFIDALFAMACVQKKLEKYKESLFYLDKLLKLEPEAIHARALKKLLLQKYLN